MRDYLLQFLKELEIAIPPNIGHHAITFNQYGSNETGFIDKLGLQISHGPVPEFDCYFLDKEDFDQSPSSLVAEIVKLRK